VTEDEIRRLYALAMAYDNRKFSEANITAWWEQAERNRWSYDEAREAIHAHHATSTEFLMPAHITGLIRQARRQPAPVAELEQLASAEPAEPERFQALVAEVADRLGWDRDRTTPDADAMSRECPHCHSRPGRPCVRQIARGHRRGELVPIANPHPSRLENPVPPNLRVVGEPRLTTEENQR
jgi:hypothetical protein